MQDVEGHGSSQDPRPLGLITAKPAQSATHPAAPLTRRLGTDREAAAVLGVGERTFADMMTSADWLPDPIILGPRLRRWDLEELLQAVRTRAPRAKRQAEPAQLARARIDRMKATGTPAAA